MFNLKDDEGILSEESFRSEKNFDSRESSCSISNSNSSGWESSISEFETETDADADDSKIEEERKERFKAVRAQHYFMERAFQHGKEFIYNDQDDNSEIDNRD